MKTRKILGIILSMVVLFGGVFVTGFQAAADGNTLSESWQSVEYGFFNFTYGADGKIVIL